MNEIALTVSRDVKTTKKEALRAIGVLELIHTNICKPFNAKSVDGFDSFITFTNDLSRYGYCRCQNRRISGRGSRTVRLGSIVTGDGGHDVYPGSGPLYGGNTLLPA